MMNKAVRKRVWCVVIVVYMLFLLVLAVLPIELPGFVNRLDPKKLLLHGLEFAVLGVLFASVSDKSKQAFFWAVLYGVFLELVQLVVPYRTFDSWDIVANALGTGIGIGMKRLLPRV